MLNNLGNQLERCKNCLIFRIKYYMDFVKYNPAIIIIIIILTPIELKSYAEILTICKNKETLLLL